MRPLVIGAYGKVNEETYLLLKNCVEIAARKPDVTKMSPTTRYCEGNSGRH